MKIEPYIQSRELKSLCRSNWLEMNVEHLNSSNCGKHEVAVRIAEKPSQHIRTM